MDIERLRLHLNEIHAGSREKLTFLPFLVQAMARTLVDWPEMNATYDDETETVTQSSPVHIGIGTQTPQGLTVPVLRHAEALDLWDCAVEIKRLSTGARGGSLAVGELGGSTITISSLGALGGLATTPVVNRPEVAIVGVNKIVERPVVVDGEIRIRRMMNLSSSFDHRVIDGRAAVTALARLEEMLRGPVTEEISAGIAQA